MKHYSLLYLLLFSPIIQAGRTVIDGFQSAIVRPSPDRPVPDPDPCFRFFSVYLPDAFDEHPEQTFPIVYHLTGLGGNYATYSATDKEAMDRLIAQSEVVPMIIVAPDPRVLNYDGSFWTDSLVVGNPTESFNNKFEQYIVTELIPFIDAKYRQKKTPSGDAAPFRAIMGQSMGGYGSLFLGIKYPQLFSGLAGESATAFWVIATNLASPPEPGFPAGNPMYTFSKFLIPTLDNGQLLPGNSDNSFAFFAWAAAFSPISIGIGPNDCSTTTNPCLANPPFCVAYPFDINAQQVPLIVGNSFVTDPTILNIWHTYDPFFLLDTADPEMIKRKAIFFDAGDDLNTEIIDNVGARYLSDKLVSQDRKHEYLLFKGGHTSCDLSEFNCYRYITDLKLFSGKFSEAGIFAPDVRIVISGTVVMEFADQTVLQIEDKALVGIETVHALGVTSTDVTWRFQDAARLEIGTQATLGGGLQIGNDFDKSNLLFDPARVTDTINFTLEVDGPDAIVQIGKQGFLGFGVGIDGNQTEVANFWGVSSLRNVASINLRFLQGRFIHNQIASALDEKASLLALGEGSYTFELTPDSFVIAGGGNIAQMTEVNRIHPTVQDLAGPIEPGGIRSRLQTNPATTFDTFYGPPKGIYASQTFAENGMTVGILSSSVMLFDSNKESLAALATKEDFFTFLKVDQYFDQGRKRAPIALLDNQLVVGYLTPLTGTEQQTIHRETIDSSDSCNPLAVPFLATKILQVGAVGIALATVEGRQKVVRLFDLNP